MAEDLTRSSNTYRIVVFGGLAVVVILTALTSLLVPPDSNLPIFVGGGAVTVFLLAFITYWWFQILYGSISERQELLETEVSQLPPVSALRSWTGLYREMALFGGDRSAFLREFGSINWKLIEWFAWATLIVFFALVNVWLYLLGILSQEQFLQFVPQVLVALCLITLLRTYMMLGSGKSIGLQDYMRVLGLQPAGGHGNTQRFRGAFAGRQVEIEVNGRNSVTTLASPAPSVNAISQDGVFEVSASAPRSVQQVLDLPKAKRWQHVSINGGKSGLRIERRSNRVNMWLFDLWLAVRLAEASDQAGKPHPTA